ncbi:unnamed protein product [Pseudo-nitzschia multistriata]|uniref:Uncharacterized protein n=1 Tax=Pseudo-nitzschia multistriata TaxID=183589 RepID=A0A448Z6S3_9STRA|nr:unnamed protein product [Pseudo-nitzschia multistriata]
MVAFDRPVGASPDAKEIEYICALHQSGETVRSDGSIRAEDIQVYLCSRFGIDVGLDEVRQTILRGMGGSSNEDEVLDLMEVTAILLIPLLLKAAYVEGSYNDDFGAFNNKGNDESETPSVASAAADNCSTIPLPQGILSPPADLLKVCADIILHDVLVGCRKDSGAETEAITTDFIRNILLMYGEDELAADQTLLEEMVEACRFESIEGRVCHDEETANKSNACATNTAFDAKAFGRGLTSDVRLYDLRNETRQSSIMEDIYFHNRIRFEDAHDGDDTTRIPKNEKSIKNLNASLLVKRRGSITAKNTIGDPTKIVPSSLEVDTDTGVETTLPSMMNIHEVKRIYTAPAIDILAGTYRSKVLIVCLWCATVFGLFSLTWIRNPLGIDRIDAKCNELYGEQGSITANAFGMFCHAGASVLNWLFCFAMFCVFGISIIGMASVGNFNMEQPRWYLPFFGCVAILLLVFPLYLQPEYSTIRSDSREKTYMYPRYTALFLLCITLYLHLTHVVTIWFGIVDFGKRKIGRIMGFSALKQELQIKQSAAFKLNLLATNAMDIHRCTSSPKVFLTRFGHGLSAYSLHGTRYVKAGGLFWCWQKFRDQTIFEEEGMFYSARLIASNLSQWFVSFFVLVVGSNFFVATVNNWKSADARAERSSFIGNYLAKRLDAKWNSTTQKEALALVHAVVKSVNATGAFCDDSSAIPDPSEICKLGIRGDWTCEEANTTEALCSLLYNPALEDTNPDLYGALLKGSGLEGAVSDFRNAVMASITSIGDSLLPVEQWMVVVPLIVGIIVAFITSIRCSLLYIPSVTTTMIQLRTGVIPALGNPDFDKCRLKPDNITLLTGASFWGCFVSAILSGAVVAFLVFLFVWQETSYAAFRIIVLGVGFVIFMLIRALLGRCCRVAFFNGLYRKKPAHANIAMLALEWANYFFTIFIIIVRMIKMIIATTASLGRIDRPFLAKGRGRKLDKLPQVHTCDLLAHEAHRHPFVETLGLVYLMKFRYSESFCHRAGSAWRLIFVYALMPWLHKHRIRGIGQRDTTYQKEKNEPYMTVPSDGVSGNDGSAIDENSFRDRSGKGTRMCRI